MMFGFFSEFFRAILDFFRKLFGIRTEKEETRGHFPLKWELAQDVLYISREENPTFADLVFSVELAPGSRSLEIAEFAIRLGASNDGANLLFEENMDEIISVASSAHWIPKRGNAPGTVVFHPAKRESVTMVGGEQFRFDLARVLLNPAGTPCYIHFITKTRQGATDEKKIVVERELVDQGISRLAASPRLINAGENVYLHWEAKGPHHYFIRPDGVFTYHNHAVVNPEKSTEYIVQHHLAPRIYQEATVKIEVKNN